MAANGAVLCTNLYFLHYFAFLNLNNKLFYVNAMFVPDSNRASLCRTVYTKLQCHGTYIIWVL